MVWRGGCINLAIPRHSVIIQLGAVHTKIDLSWIDLRSISVRFEKVFTLI